MSNYRQGRHGYPEFGTTNPGRWSEPIDTTDPRQPIAPFREPEPLPPPVMEARPLPVCVGPDPALEDLQFKALRVGMIRDGLLIVFLVVATFYLGALIFSWSR